MKPPNKWEDTGRRDMKLWDEDERWRECLLAGSCGENKDYEWLTGMSLTSAVYTGQEMCLHLKYMS